VIVLRKSASLLLLVLFLVASVGSFLPVNAAPHTIVVPDDYPTLTAAIDSAGEGDTIFFRKGTYEGPENQTVTINKAVSLIGEDAEGTILSFHPPLVQMSIFTYSFMGYLNSLKLEADNVKIVNFTIKSDKTSTLAGNGGAVSLSGNSIQVSGNMIDTIITGTGNQTQIVKNTVNAIHLDGFNQVLSQNKVNGRVGDGEFLISCTGSNNTLESNFLSGELSGVCVNGEGNSVVGNMFNYTGVTNGALTVNGDKNIIARNDVTNVSAAVSLSGFSNQFYGNKVTNLAITGNDNIIFSNCLHGLFLGDRVHDASNNTFFHNNFDFVENNALPSGEKTFTVWEGVKGINFLDNGKEGNYWSDYKGTDLGSDGIGDTPYIIDAKDPLNYHYIADFNVANVTLTDHYPLMTPFDIAKDTVAQPDFSVSPEPSLTGWVLTVSVLAGIILVALLVVYFKINRNKPA
jgi:hypothetical protein